MANATGKTVEIPIKSNFREGLSILEYFISSNGARKGLADTALRTADSGYLTRRLVDVSHSVIVREYDCGTDEGVEVRAFTDGKEVIEPLKQRIVGRTALVDIVDPQTGEVIVEQNEEILEAAAERIENSGIESVAIRSVMTCHSRTGICAKCYGRNLASGEEVNIGEAVGITAAQSIGEPGTQLTMRTFNTGGVAGDDITQGLPRVQELFEARNPKGKATISEINGVVTKIEDNGGQYSIFVKNDTETREHVTNYGAKLHVELNEEVKAGQKLTVGAINPKELLAVTDPLTVQNYIVFEIQKVYRSQGVDVSDKHVEIIAKRMISKMKIVNSGDSFHLPGTMVNINKFADLNKELIINGKRPATGRPVLLGITKASLETDSFLSAASFQETTRILTDAAIHGRVDKLEGLKENVMIGKLIPAGTGAKQYKKANYDLELDILQEEPLEALEQELMD